MNHAKLSILEKYFSIFSDLPDLNYTALYHIDIQNSKLCKIDIIINGVI